MEGIAVYSGSFDPPTLGHLNLVERSLAIFDRLIVAVAINSSKANLFTPQERVDMLQESLVHLPPKRVEVVSFQGLLVDFAQQRGATAILRGLRATRDFDYEFQMAMANNHLAPQLQSVFLMTEARWLYLSSTIVKEVASHGADMEGMVPLAVARCLKEKFPRS